MGSCPCWEEVPGAARARNPFQKHCPRGPLPLSQEAWSNRLAKVPQEQPCTHKSEQTTMTRPRQVRHARMAGVPRQLRALGWPTSRLVAHIEPIGAPTSRWRTKIQHLIGGAGLLQTRYQAPHTRPTQRTTGIQSRTHCCVLHCSCFWSNTRPQVAQEGHTPPREPAAYATNLARSTSVGRVQTNNIKLKQQRVHRSRTAPPSRRQRTCGHMIRQSTS